MAGRKPSRCLWTRLVGPGCWSWLRFDPMVSFHKFHKLSPKNLKFPIAGYTPTSLIYNSKIRFQWAYFALPTNSSWVDWWVSNQWKQLFQPYHFLEIYRYHRPLRTCSRFIGECSLVRFILLCRWRSRCSKSTWVLLLTNFHSLGWAATAGFCSHVGSVAI